MEYPDGEPYGHEREDYQLLECKGCDEVKLKITSSSSDYETYVQFHPAATLRPRPNWLSDFYLEALSNNFYQTLIELLNEVYKALQNGMPRLAVMGIRALLEAIMVDKIGDKGGFAKNVAALAAAGHIGEKQKGRILAVLDVGSAAMHRGYAPRVEDVVPLLNLTENLVESIYVHDDQIDAVTKKVPQRPRRGQV